MTQADPFSSEQLQVVRFCAIECRLQESGEQSVYNMVSAWDYARRKCQYPVDIGTFPWPTEADILHLGALVEPEKNAAGYRQVDVRVGWDVKGPWAGVPGLMADLMKVVATTHASEWFRQYEEVHPFIDGNGRTGALLYNWLRGSLGNPSWPPNFWHDSRRRSHFGAP